MGNKIGHRKTEEIDTQKDGLVLPWGTGPKPFKAEEMKSVFYGDTPEMKQTASRRSPSQEEHNMDAQNTEHERAPRHANQNVS